MVFKLSLTNNKKPISIFLKWESVEPSSLHSIKFGQNRYFYLQNKSVFANEALVRCKFLVISVFQPIGCLVQLFYIAADLFSANFYQRAKQELIFSKLSRTDHPEHLIAREFSKSLAQLLLRPAVSAFLIVVSVAGIFFGFDAVPFYSAIERKTLPLIPIKGSGFNFVPTPFCMQIKGYPYLFNPFNVLLYQLKEKGFMEKDFYCKLPKQKNFLEYFSVLQNQGVAKFIEKLNNFSNDLQKRANE